ncbi:HlyD family efflux transporter periplasmic adaptor subunit [Ectothiorhodospira sp. BSL-9]|uniref:HlyD family efflux transporter periplasmic adaptor subunit n=1 Tax=Ectothiorhodospira sp. BSL-9 TaxID=1442136 RepID=UPI0007B4276F|nr:HlyD family efflux transporter periplasmic adaptor subunit [Ectothiorhodospira sp. BSL-9]ANB03169.1 secretion protein [Ectothiorhodospira sp. BSL-9]
MTPLETSAASRSSRLLIPLVAATLVAFLSWAAWATIDQITRVQGTVIPSARNQVIQSMDPARVSEILVREGDLVRAGDVLVRLDRTRTEALFLETRAKVAAQTAAVSRLSAEIMGTEPDFPDWLAEYPEILANHRHLFQRRQQSLATDIQVQQDILAIIDDELELTEPLRATGDVSQVEILRLQRQRADTRGKIVTRRHQYFQEVQQELSQAQEQLEALQQLLVQHREVLQNTEIIAPMDGVVRNVRITTRGAVVGSGEEIMQIVPVEDDFVIEARVRPMDIAYVRPGLEANVKLDAYDFMIYGAFPGTVQFISADTLEDETNRARDEEPHYRVHVVMEGKDLVGLGPNPVRVQPGMTATVEIKTGENTVLGFLTKPITRGISQSFGER